MGAYYPDFTVFHRALLYSVRVCAGSTVALQLEGPGINIERSMADYLNFHSCMQGLCSAALLVASVHYARRPKLRLKCLRMRNSGQRSQCRPA